MDPQGNASTGMGIERARREITSYDLLSGAASVAEATLATVVPGMNIVPASVDLSGAEIELVEEREREFLLRRALEPAIGAYDYILIDCPPSLGLLTLNALVAADAVIIPLHCEYFALEGLADLVGTMRRVRATLNPSLDIDGVLLTMYDDRTNLGQLVARDVREFFKEKVFNTIIPRNVRLGEAPSHGMPAVLYDGKSRGAAAYVALAQEMLARRAA
jgi:chromosome partitioning protein